MTAADLIRELYKKQNIIIAGFGRAYRTDKAEPVQAAPEKFFTHEEAKQIADVMDMKFEHSFTLPDGEQY